MQIPKKERGPALCSLAPRTVCHAVDTRESKAVTLTLAAPEQLCRSGFARHTPALGVD